MTNKIKVSQPKNDALIVGDKKENIVVERLSLIKGDKGDSGDPVSISADPNNAIKHGSDGRMLVDDVLSTNCTTDFLSIYQLSK